LTVPVPNPAAQGGALASRSSRLSSLDGLRGVAALAVVLYHIALTSSTVARAYLHPAGANYSFPEWLLFYTPLHVFWAGREAVIVFFVLSGFVLALPAARGKRMVWRSYYPRRVLRLYLPSIGSLLFAFLTTLIITPVALPGASEWLNEHATMPHGLHQVIAGATLMGKSEGLNTPLWSIQWEVIFSLLLPVYVVLAKILVKYSLVVAGLLLIVEFAGVSTGILSGALTYLPVFAVGVVMAFNSERLADGARALTTPRWFFLSAAAFLLIVSHWLVGGFIADANTFRPISTILNTVGAAIVVYIGAWGPAARVFLGRAPVRWLGRVSFSLYLTHEPIVVATAFALGPEKGLWLTYVISVPIALIFAEVFYRVVEGPAHRLSQLAGSAMLH
jgi:peptidoglycan/LPS O-acetylase OafA/YrhL